MNGREFLKKSLEGIVVGIPLISGCSKNPVDYSTNDFYYYYANGRKVQLNLSKDKITVRFNEGVYIETKN